MSTAYNNVGITGNNGTPLTSGAFDGTNSYSADLLTTQGFTQGGTFTTNGVTFTIPAHVATPYYDNYSTAGQTITFAPVSNATAVAFLGASSGASSSGTATINYTTGAPQTFTLGFTYWLTGTAAYSNALAVTTSNYNTTAGAKSPAALAYIYYADSSTVTLDPTRVVASVTLPPAPSSGGVIHVFAAALKTSNASPNTYNNIGISNNSAPASANYDGSGNSYSAQALAAATPTPLTPGATVTVNGVAFTWPNVLPGTLDNWQTNGQVIPVTPVANASVLAFLGSATGGDQEATGTITYSDSSTANFPLFFNDWLDAPGSPIVPENQLVTTAAYYHSASGMVNAPAYVYYSEVPLLRGKTVVSVTLPATTNPQLHVFAISTGGTAYNNTGISDDSAPLSANFDAAYNSYSAEALANATPTGVTPGSTVIVNGMVFTWPNVPAGSPDNYQAAGQTIPFATFPNDSVLAFLGSAHFGPSIGTGTINYNDGSKQNFHLAFSDWTLNANTSAPAFGNIKALTMPYRNARTSRDNAPTYVFYTQVTLQNPQSGMGKGKVVVSITLPTTTNQGKLHVFAISSTGD